MGVNFWELNENLIRILRKFENNTLLQKSESKRAPFKNEKCTPLQKFEDGVFSKCRERGRGGWIYEMREAAVAESYFQVGGSCLLIL